MAFTRAVKHGGHLRMALIGPAGTGKTFTSLRIACALAKQFDTRVAVIDTERGSARKYADQFTFDVLELQRFAPLDYVEAIHAAEAAGYGVLVVDGLSQAWSGKGGALEIVDQVARRSKSTNSFGAWRDVTPMHNTMVDALIGAKLHLIATLRSKTEYVQERDEQGKTRIRKVGLAPVQRDGLEYEFDIVGELDHDNMLTVTKSRCSALAGAMVLKPGEDLASTLAAWLDGPAAPKPDTTVATDTIENPMTGEAAPVAKLGAVLRAIAEAATEEQLHAVADTAKHLRSAEQAKARQVYRARLEVLRGMANQDEGTRP